MKLDKFVPFCGPSYGKVITLAMTEFVDLCYLISRPQFDHILDARQCAYFYDY